MTQDSLWQRLWTRWMARRIPAAAQIELNSRRIFIAPSGVGLAFAVALMLLLLAAINYQNSLAYGLTFLLASLFVVSILHTYRNLAGLQLQAGLAEPTFQGQQAYFTVRLHSQHRAHQALALGWRGQALQSLNLEAQASLELRLSRLAEHRGWLRPGRLRIESTYPLGLLRAWSWLDLQQQALIYPQPVAAALETCLGLSDASAEGQQTRGSGVDDFQGLRHYVAGDSRRRLHWKAYSKGQGLLVKDFAALTGRDLQLDFGAISGDLEYRLSVLCHWVLQLSQTEQAFSLRLPGLMIEVAQGAAHRDRCLRHLALFEANR